MKLRKTLLLLNGWPEMSHEEGMSTGESTAGGGGGWTDSTMSGYGSAWLESTGTHNHERRRRLKLLQVTTVGSA